jgi:hypothetical protein
MTAAGEESGGNATADYEKTGGYGERQQAGASADSDRVREEAEVLESYRQPVGDTAGMRSADNNADDEAGHGADSC